MQVPSVKITVYKWLIDDRLVIKNKIKIALS